MPATDMTAMPDLRALEASLDAAKSLPMPDEKRLKTLQENFAERVDALLRAPGFERMEVYRLFHFSRYALAAKSVAGKDVLDCACGTGYGSWLLARGGAKSVKGVDIDAESVDYARYRYASDNVSFSEGDAFHLDFPDESFDMVVSFETIEHTQRPRLALTEFYRVLKPGGTFFVSVPFQSFVGNPHHFYSFSYETLTELLSPFFKPFEFYGYVKNEFQKDGLGVLCPMRPEDPTSYALAFCRKLSASGTNARHVFLGPEKAFAPLWELGLPLKIKHWADPIAWEEAINALPDALFLAEVGCMEQSYLLQEARRRNIATVLVIPSIANYFHDNARAYDLIVLTEANSPLGGYDGDNVERLTDPGAAARIEARLRRWTDGEPVAPLSERWYSMRAGTQIVYYRNCAERLKTEYTAHIERMKTEYAAQLGQTQTRLTQTQAQLQTQQAFQAKIERAQAQSEAQTRTLQALQSQLAQLTQTQTQLTLAQAKLTEQHAQTQTQTQLAQAQSQLAQAQTQQAREQAQQASAALERERARGRALSTSIFEIEQTLVEAVLENLRLKGVRKLAIYGGGAHTARVLKKRQLSAFELVYIVDDNPASHGKRIAGAKIVSPMTAVEAKPDAILISSDTIEEKLAKNAARWAPKGTALVKIYGRNIWENGP